MSGFVNGTFSGDGNTAAVGGGPVKYRLNCSGYSTGSPKYFFGYDQLVKPNTMILILTGTFTATITVQYSDDNGTTWTAVPNESYTAADSRRYS